MSKDAQRWHRGNLKLEGGNWFVIQLKRIYVLTFKSRHCNVYHMFWRYFSTVLSILIILGLLFGAHFLLFPPE